MSLLSELKTIIEARNIQVETGVFKDSAPDCYAVLTPLTDELSLYADDAPEHEVQEVRVSLFDKGNYNATKNALTRAFIAAGIAIMATNGGDLWDYIKGGSGKLIDAIIRGGWPGNQDIPLNDAAILPVEYVNGVIEDEVHRIDGIQRDKRKARLLLRSLARNESTTATNRTLKNDVKELDDEDIDKDTVAAYLDIFNRLFLTDNLEPFSSNIRSSVRLKQAEKRHLADPSLSAALLGATPNKLIGDLNTLGFLFEALCERDLRIYCEAFNGKLYHYQDYLNKEIDAVIELENGDWCAFEIKLGANKIDEGAGNLVTICKSIKHDGGKLPKICCVVCGMTNAAYKRQDGVYVVPITALKE